MTVQYKQLEITAAAGAKADQQILSGLSGMKRTVRLIGTTADNADILLTLRNQQTTLAEIPSAANMGFGYWFPAEITLAEGDDIYIGLDNKTAGSITQRVAIAYEEAPATGG